MGISCPRVLFSNKLNLSRSDIDAKFTFLNKVILLISNSTLSSVEILQMLRSIEFPLRFIRLDDHKFLRYIRDILGVTSYC